MLNNWLNQDYNVQDNKQEANIKPAR